jgi:hypothetical protein
MVLRGGALLSLSLVLACAEIGSTGGPELEGKLSQAPNGTLLNGRYLNGRYLNGVYLNGRYLNGRYLNGVTLADGTVSDEVVVHRTQIFAQVSSCYEVDQWVYADGDVLGARLGRCAPDGMWLYNRSLEGATIEAAIASDGTAWKLRIDRSEIMPQEYASSSVDWTTVQRTSEAVYWYQVSYQASANDWQPVCGADEHGNPHPAVFLAGRWDYTTGEPTSGSRIDEYGAYTLACANTALGKCAALTYGPWRDDEYPLVDEWQDLFSSAPVDSPGLHQACTRMIRADYCGDGTPYTQDGTAIDVFDAHGKNVEWVPWWDLDAVWGPDGALCINYDPDGSGRRSTEPVHCAARVPDCASYAQEPTLVNRTDNGVDLATGCGAYPSAPACQQL